MKKGRFLFRKNKPTCDVGFLFSKVMAKHLESPFLKHFYNSQSKYRGIVVRTNILILNQQNPQRFAHLQLLKIEAIQMMLQNEPCH
jgi:accessory colonization factor AcfC